MSRIVFHTIQRTVTTWYNSKHQNGEMVWLGSLERLREVRRGWGTVRPDLFLFPCTALCPTPCTALCHSLCVQDLMSPNFPLSPQTDSQNTSPKNYNNKNHATK